MNICWLYYFTYFYKCYTFNLQLDIVLRMCHRLLRLSISRPDLNSFSQPLNQAHLLCSLYQFVTHHIHPRSQVRNLAFLLSPAPCIKLIPKSDLTTPDGWCSCLCHSLLLWLFSCCAFCCHGQPPTPHLCRCDWFLEDQDRKTFRALPTPFPQGWVPATPWESCDTPHLTAS